MAGETVIPEPILPGGTVTFLFTDIEGSTQLLNRLRDQYEDLISAHHSIVRRALARWNGREIDTQGDAFFAVFRKASEAVIAVVEIQRSLYEHSWPEGVLVRVRMGLHTGEPWLVEEGYMGMDVHRAARIGHVGYGGQVLLSETTTSLVLDELPEGVALLPLGRHQLKDMRRPEPIHQLVIKGLPSNFPPLKSLEALPAVQTSPVGSEAPREPRDVGPSPYRGLAAFREADSELFFGRESFVGQLVKAVGERHLVAVIVGPSGSGKSSTVFAGLLPQLREGGQWLIIETRPGNKPFHALAGALIPHLESEDSETKQLVESQRLAQAMKAGEIGLFHVVNRILAQDGKAKRVLLVIDQFEELFTHKPDPDVQQYFLDELIAAAEAGSSYRRSPLVILLTLRADFMGQALGHRPFADALQEGSLILGPMNRSELQAAVEKPAELAGAAFEPGLVQRMLDDVGQEPGNLPLLEFALTLLWERKEQGWMTHAAYDEIGRVDGALARYADEVWAELDADEQGAARSFFVQLVQPGEGTEDTRRVAKRGELAEGHWPLVQHLADKRLVVTGRDEAGEETVEVVHEALIRGWDRLREWMMDDRAFRTWQEGLRVAQRGWDASNQDEGALLRGAPLVLALEWMDQNKAALAPSEKEFIEASNREKLRRAAEDEARRQRELETAQKLAETEHVRAEEQARSAYNLRRRAYFLGGALVLAALLAVFAGFFAWQSNENANIAATSEAEALVEAGQRATAQAEARLEKDRAELEAALASSRELAAASRANLNIDPERSVLLAIAALDVVYSQEAEEALHLALPKLRVVKTLKGHTDMVNSLDFSSDGDRLITASADGTARIWEVESGKTLLSLEGHEGWVNIAVYSPDGSFAVTTSDDGTALIWDTIQGEVISILDSHRNNINLDNPDWPPAVTGAAISPDSTLVATTSNDGTAKIWEAETGLELQEISGNEHPLGPAAFSPDGSRLAIAGSDGFAEVVDVTSGEVLFQLAGHEAGWVRGISYSPDGTTLATDGEDGSVRLWDAETGRLLKTFPNLNLMSVDFNSDGTRLIGSSVNGTAKTIDIASGRELITLIGHQDRVWWARFGPEDDRAASASADHTTKIWDLSQERELQTLTPFPDENPSDITALSISPDGAILAVAGATGRVALWDLRSGQQIVELGGHDAWVGGANFSPDGRLLVTAADDQQLVLWKVPSGELHLKMEDPNDMINDAAFSPDGTLVAGVGYNPNAFIWEAKTGELLHTLPLRDGAWGLAFHPDGSLLATGDVSGYIVLWDAVTGEPIKEFDYDPTKFSSAYRLAFTPDGSRIIVSALDGTVKIWDLQQDDVLMTIKAHQNLIWGMDLSPDGKTLATAAADNTARLWNLDTGERILTLEGHTAPLLSVRFSPDGRSLVTSSQDGTVRVYLLALEDLIALAKSRLTRSLTTEECQQYLHLDRCPSAG